MKMNKLVIFNLITVVLCVNSVSSITPEQTALIQSKLLTSGLSCIRNNPLTLSEIRALKDQMFPDGENAKCFAACLFKNIGVMNEMGYLNLDNARNIAGEVFKNSDNLHKTEQILQECSSVNDTPTSDGAKGCDRAKLAFECLSRNAEKHDFHIIL